MRCRKYKYFAYFCVIVYLYYFTGIHDYLNTKDFEETFNYPLNIDLKDIVEGILQGQKSTVTPINYYPHRFITTSEKCSAIDKLDLVIVVKSAMNHFGHRIAVRKSYGQENTMPGKIIKTLFFLGVERRRTSLQNKIDRENAEYNDIIQINFVDNYYNNTIKTIMSFRWLYEYCASADYYLFTDDDMYISVKNLLNYVENEASVTKSAMLEQDRNNYMSELKQLEEVNYNYRLLKPRKLERHKNAYFNVDELEGINKMLNSNLKDLERDSNVDVSKLHDLDSDGTSKPYKLKKRDKGFHSSIQQKLALGLDKDNYNNIAPGQQDFKREKHFYAGYVFKSAPIRLVSSKWRVTLKEYPWDRWPDYVTAGAYIVSNKSMKTIYVASLFVKHFRFDDIYLGIVARKVGIKPVHCANFYYYKKKYNKEDYKDVIASHGYGNHEELLRVWHEQDVGQ